ncbi:hypothetical protein I601_0268 [Nocardioides dokdonensis FR1436]|uniref:DUF3017 domain-containing protein n=1 Tax=Nocardioides dokdonensis FR1436 TaxID=1300347 RepID=A0A1A9GGR8_9ACTN|nr:DUF3017 domain-containing protein [Nocardioides dokdonensis]ANH36721.1 hypothetical protein I601_0268 [Nocardioides dokdonensis FR1436]
MSEPTIEPADDLPPSVEEIAEEIHEEEGRRYPSTIGGLLYLCVLATGALGITLAALGDWRLGVTVLAGALMAGAGLRLVLPARDAGMLAVRHRFLDVALLGGVGGLMLFLARTIPNQPGL